jgi:hypothetical protein
MLITVGIPLLRSQTVRVHKVDKKYKPASNYMNICLWIQELVITSGDRELHATVLGSITNQMPAQRCDTVLPAQGYPTHQSGD